MKRFALLGLVLVLAGFGGMNNVQAEEKSLTEQEIAAKEADFFTSLETLDTSSDAKFAEQLEASEGDGGAAKCWFWCVRRRGILFPRYTYYTWYCPVYRVPLRIVTYAVPVAAPAAGTVITTPAPVSAEPAATSIVVKFQPSSGKVAKGAVIDGKVPADSPLVKLGLRSGDIITKVDGNPVNSMLDARRIRENSEIEFVRGEQIKVASKQLLQNEGSQSGSVKSASVDFGSLQAVQEREMSLYEYYDMQEKGSVMK
ncbi:MAG: PDZ domain-containing protein [Planctomycetaceae bacterium]|nr:PDZ domain-containing protein [Planctomycetaceae bacterium]